MKGEAFLRNKSVGSVDLAAGDRSMGHLYGEFLPTESYYTEMDDNLWRFGDIMVYEDWFFSNLNIQLDNGYFIYAAGGVTFEELTDDDYAPKKIDIAGVDAHVIDDFFSETKPAPFVIEPWETITIEQKLLFEEELKKETGTFNSLPGAAGHPLAKTYFSALCHNGYDILFISRRKGEDAQFAVIHLTWKGSLELPDYPKATFFKDFDEFKILKMYTDKADWER